MILHTILKDRMQRAIQQTKAKKEIEHLKYICFVLLKYINIFEKTNQRNFFTFWIAAKMLVDGYHNFNIPSRDVVTFTSRVEKCCLKRDKKKRFFRNGTK